MDLVFNYKDMLERVTMQRTQQFSAFVCYQKKNTSVINLDSCENGCQSINSLKVMVNYA